MTKAKIGRNEPCPCGSGKKYKKCHGSIGSFVPLSDVPDSLKQLMKEAEARRVQAEKQQGLGRPIVSAELRGRRLVAVGNRVYHSTRWKTFHDFLFEYIKTALGGEWGNQELAKPYSTRHPILQWYESLCRFQQDHNNTRLQVKSSPMNGAVAAYLGLAYNLYLLAHNVQLQTRLIKRLKDANQFHGAYYETFVAAAFIKAGFAIELENERDGSTTHCEFTATHSSGRKYSVEAKARHLEGVLGVSKGGGGSLDGKLKIGHQLHAALRKRAAHMRIVFIDVNVPDAVTGTEETAWLSDALGIIRSKEPTLTIDGESAPPAYVFVTNLPYHHSPESLDFRVAIIGEGFKIADFKIGASYSSLREARSSREKHRDMYQLIHSFSDQHVPSTFDGEIPEYAFGEVEVPRLLIGHRYAIPNEDGNEVIGTLTQAVVMENERKVWGVYVLDTGATIIATAPMSDVELEAYRRHPDTFFGVYQQVMNELKGPLELFDSLYNTYQHTEKEKLLDWMGESIDITAYKELPQKELAEMYCEGLVYSAMRTKDKKV